MTKCTETTSQPEMRALCLDELETVTGAGGLPDRYRIDTSRFTAWGWKETYIYVSPMDPRVKVMAYVRPPMLSQA